MSQSSQSELARRLRSQGLTAPSMSVVDAVAGAVGLQAQDEVAALLGVRARTRGRRASEVVRALDDGALVRTWAMRGTLHLLTADDAGWIVPLLGPLFEARAQRRLAELGLDADTLARGVDGIRAILEADGPQPRDALIAALAGRGSRFEGQARPHLLGHAARAGVVALGANEEVRPFTPSPRDRTEALQELARRYQRAFAPATAEDFGYWSGLPAADVRIGWSGGSVGRESAPPQARLVGAFDNLLLGWRDRGALVPERFVKRVLPGGGVVRAAMLAEGRVAGTWRLQQRTRVTLEPFEPLIAEVDEAFRAEGEDVVRFLAE